MVEQKKGLEDMDWVIDYITEWIEKNTKFKVSLIQLTERK